MRLISERRALGKLAELRARFSQKISEEYEWRAERCSTCKTPGDCCLDAHFVNVRISRLEATAIAAAIAVMPTQTRDTVLCRAEEAVESNNLLAGGDDAEQTYACPLFERNVGCLVHSTAKPLPCIHHACYKNETDVPPHELLTEAEARVARLNGLTYGKSSLPSPLPVAILNAHSR